ncbi:hypothetical protein NL349_28110, partial [Klebsiella pneumoniae]|nr:hypothetical protein [Klebsiella pneumoniae]
RRVKADMGGAAAGGQLGLVMWAQGVFHGSVGVVNILHGDIAVAIAKLRGGEWRGGRAALRQIAVGIVAQGAGGRLLGRMDEAGLLM